MGRADQPLARHGVSVTWKAWLKIAVPWNEWGRATLGVRDGCGGMVSPCLMAATCRVCALGGAARGYPGLLFNAQEAFTMTPLLSRRQVLALGLAPATLLSACGTPLPLATRPAAQSSPAQTAGTARLLESAQAHGLDAYRRITDINIAYDGRWRPLIDRVQPIVVDKGFRGASQERLMPAAGINAQAYTGPAGSKQVWWQRGDTTAGDVAVWFNGQRSSNPDVLAASALVAECYRLFLLGPLLVASRGVLAELAGTERVNGRFCDVVNVWLTPGLGQVALDRVALCIDRDDSITRRMRFTLEGFANTQGAVAETDTFEHQRHFGVLWPMRSYEEVVHPLRLPAHDWFITALDVNRGYPASALQGPVFSGGAAPAAARL